jgi:Fibronectin type III domain/Listeria-Bacteroides repeat domain (List_Bact_rpt)
VIRRRFSASLAALAVVAAGLAWGVSPATAAISGQSITPSTWTVGASEAATIAWTESTSISSVMVRSPWPWGATYAGTVGTPSSVPVTPTGGTTAPWIIACPYATFTLPAASTVPNPVNCKSANSPSSPNFFRAFWVDGITVTGAIQVALNAGVVTAPTTARTDTWIIGKYSTANTAADIALAGNVEVATTAVAVDSTGAPLPIVTINIDGNGGTCSTTQVTGFSSTWATAPTICRSAGKQFTGFNTAADGSGLAIAPGGNLHLTGDNTLYAQYVTPRVSSAPTDVVATPGLKKVTVTWKAPSDAGTGPINGYLVRASPGSSSCVTNLASANMLECTYTNLRPGTKYTFAVQALNQAGWSNFSAASSEAAPYDILLDSISRPEVKLLFISRGSNLEAEGRAPGLREGTKLTPMMQVGAGGTFVPQTGNLARVDAKGRYSWSTRLDRKQNGKPVSVYFMLGDAKTTTLTANLGATVGLPSAPRDVKVTSTTDGITVSWKAPARNGGSPITGYAMTSDLRTPAGAPSKFVSCKVAAPTTTCTMRASTNVFDPNKTYAFSVVARTERGASREATQNWKGQVYRLNIFKRARVDSEVLLSFSAFGWERENPTFEIQAKVGENGTWKKQGTARLDPDYVDPIADWAGMLPRSAAAGTTVFYRVKSNKGYSNEVRFRLDSSFEYSFG